MKSSMDNLEQARLLSKGDQKAMEGFFKEHYNTLVYFAAHLINDRPMAEDIVTETFHKLWNLRANFDTPQNIKAFLYITTRNACFNYLQHLKVRRNSVKELSYMSGEGLEEKNAELHWMESELMSAIIRELDRLPSRTKIIAKLYLLGFSTEEISSRLNLSQNTVRVQKSRAVKQLRVALLKKGLLIAILCCLIKRLVSSGCYVSPGQQIVSQFPDHRHTELSPGLYSSLFLVINDPPGCSCRYPGLPPLTPATMQEA